MNANAPTVENLLTEAQQLVQNEYNHLQIVGRALTDEELRRSDTLSSCLEHIQKALDALSEK